MFRKTNPPVGSRPGTLAIPEGSPPPRIRLIAYDADGVEERDVEDPDGLDGCLGEDGVTWIDVQGLGDEAVLRRVGEVFSLHPLALEDAVNVPQRAKVESYAEHLLVIARLPLIDESGGVSAPQVCFVIGPRYLLTFQERYFGFFDPVRERIRAGIGPIRSQGPDYLAYALLDTLVDRYYPIAEGLSHQLEDLEDEILEDPRPDTLARLHVQRRQLTVVRRVGWPQREAVNELLRIPSRYVSDEVRVFLRDTHDHIAQIMELVDSSREMAMSLMDIYLSSISQRTNDVMKVLTLMASIFIPLTFLAGIYGMNFEYMPELQSRAAYPVLLLTMFGVAGGMVVYFRRRGWIGGRRRRDRDSGER